MTSDHGTTTSWIERSLAHYQSQRESLLTEIEQIESGTLRHKTRVGGIWEDTTGEALEIAKRDLEQIDFLINEYSKRKS